MSAFRISDSARRALTAGASAGDPVANLERLGLPTRVLNVLEESRFQIILLDDLLARSREDLLSIDSLGHRSFEQIVRCLACYDKLPREFSCID